MAIFDERAIEASHNRLASTISAQFLALSASVDLIRTALLHQDVSRNDPDDDADYLAVSQLGFRVINDVGAASKLLDCGYFVQAAGLLRDISEVGMLALYFAIYPQDLRTWRNLSGPQQSSKFGPRALRNNQNLKHTEKFEYFDKRFRLFSDYGTHPSATSIIAHYDGEQFYIGPHFNENLYVNTYRDLADLAWHVTDVCGDAYEAIFGVSVGVLCPNEVEAFRLSWNAIAPRTDKREQDIRHLDEQR